MANKKDVYIPTVGEEIANTVTHGVMSLVALVALPFGLTCMTPTRLRHRFR